MREDILHEEEKQLIQYHIRKVRNFFESNRGMWQRKNGREYPLDDGFLKAGIFFGILGVGFWIITEMFLLFSEESFLNYLYIRSFFYLTIFFFCGSILINTLDIYIYNHYKTKIFKYLGIAICIVFFIPMVPFLALFYFFSKLLNIIDITFDSFTTSICIMGLDTFIIVILTGIGVFFSDYIFSILEWLIRIISWPMNVDINYSAILLFIIFLIISFLISFFSRIFDYLFRKNSDEESRRKILRLIYLYKLLLLTYVFIICIFTYSLGDDLGKDVLNVVTFFTVIILLNDKFTALFISKNMPKEFKVQIEWNNKEIDTPNEEETLIGTEDKPEEKLDEIVEEEDVSEIVESINLFIEPRRDYDSSTIKQSSYRYIRTHKLPNNKKIYRIRKERIRKIFLPK